MSPRTPIGHDLLERLGSLEAVDGPAQAIGKFVRNLKSPTKVDEALAGTWLGHPVHPVLILVPMGTWSSAVLLDWLGGEDAETAADLLLGAGLAAAVPTVATGYADWADTEPANDTVRRVGIVHAAVNATAAMLFGASLAARAAGARGRGKLLALAGLGAISAGGYLGGHLTYAEGVGVDTTTFEDYPEDWTQALADAALGEGEMKAVDVEGAAILIARQRRPRLRAGEHLRAPRGLAGRRRAGRRVRRSARCTAARSRSSTAPSSRARPPTRSRCSRRACATARSRCAPRSSAGTLRSRAMAEIKTVGVLGAGLMGHGIAQVVRAGRLRRRAARGRRRPPRKGVGKIEKQLARAVEKGKLEQGDADAARGRITPTLDYADFADCDLVIEAITEDLGLKLEMWREIDGIVKPEAYFATNTSSLAVVDQAAATSRPERFLGLHFFNPAQVMALVEVIRAVTTSDEAFQVGLEFAGRLGKQAGPDRDSAGFIVNRLLVPYMLDAIRAYEEGVGSIAEIDDAMKAGAGHPMGPLTLADFVGLDTIGAICDVLFDEFRERRFARPPLLRKMLSAGWYGRKSGMGFYDYSGEGPVPNPGI